MALVLEILLGLMVLASFFVAYKSAETWPIYQVVLAELVFLGSVTFFILGARTLATHKAWRTLVEKNSRELENVDKRTKEITAGVLDPGGQVIAKGTEQLKADLAKLTSDRGGVLYDVKVEGVNDSVAQLTMNAPNHGLTANAVLFVFDQTPTEQGGRYLGEFKVTAVGEESPTVQLAPNLPLTDAQARRLATAKGPWTLYTTMPIDDLSPPVVPPKPVEAQGADSVSGVPIPPAEPAQAAVPAALAGTDRKLRDYEFIFHENYNQRSMLADHIGQVTSNLDRTNAAVSHTLEEIAYRETEKRDLAADLSKFQFERKAVAAYQQSLDKLVSRLRESLKTTYTVNRQKAAEFTAEQLKAAEEINARTNSAQASARQPVPLVARPGLAP